MGSLLVVSVSILTVGLTATTRTENVTMGGYYPGIIVSAAPLGSGLGWRAGHRTFCQGLWSEEAEPGGTCVFSWACGCAGGRLGSLRQVACMSTGPLKGRGAGTALGP